MAKWLALVGLAFVAVGQARADTITYTFTGEFTGGTLGSVGVGTPAKGTFTFDTSAPDVDPSPGGGTYPGAGEIQLTLLSSSPFTLGSTGAEVAVTAANGSTPSYSINVVSPVNTLAGAAPEPFPGATLKDSFLVLDLLGGVGAGNDQLPASLLLSDFSEATLSVLLNWFFTPPGSDEVVVTDFSSIRLSSLTGGPDAGVAAAPEPTSLVLVSLGALGLCGPALRRRLLRCRSR